jgi:4-amino-4-deoxy-L-arabinose transferase-like glycosyltransferase
MSKKIFCWTVLISTLCLGFFLRLESVKNTHVINGLTHDARDYFMYAYNLRYHHVYSSYFQNREDSLSLMVPDAIRTPGYPLLLWFFVDKNPTEKTLESIATAQIIISTFTLGFAFFFFRMFLPVSWSLIASLFTALSPHLIVMNSYILSETLFCFTVVLFAWSVGFSRIRPSAWKWWITGMVLGFASLVRPGIQYFPIFMIILLVGEYKWKRGLKYFGMLILGYVLMFSPWVIRNETTLGAAGDKTLMINFLHHGMYPNFTYANKPESYRFPYKYDPRSKDISQSIGTVLQEITRRLQEELEEHLKWYLLGKPIAFWSWNIVVGVGDVFVYSISQSPYFSVWYFQWTHLLMKILHGPLVILATMGSIAAWFPLSSLGLSKERVFTARFISLLLLYFTSLHMIGAPFPRYSVPLRPFIYGMALFLPYLALYCLHKRLRP